MASISLDRAYLNLASDPSQYVTLYPSAKSEQPSVTGSQNQYAGARFRVVIVAGTTEDDDLTFTMVDKATRDQLHAWIGQTVCYRDPNGVKHYGAYLTYKTTQQLYPNLADVEIQNLLTVTFSEID